MNMGLRDLEMKELNCLEVSRGVAWTALVHDKKEDVLFNAENHGRGGCNLYRVDGMKVKESNRYISGLEKEARVVLGKKFEALDSVMAYLEPGLDINVVIQQILLDKD